MDDDDDDDDDNNNNNNNNNNNKGATFQNLNKTMTGKQSRLIKPPTSIRYESVHIAG